MSSGSVTTTRNDFSNGTINGSADDDTVILNGTGSNDAILLGAGEDVLAVNGRYTNLTVTGGADSDTISGVGSFSIVNGNTGADLLNLNSDIARGLTVFGGQGSDIFGSSDIDAMDGSLDDGDNFGTDDGNGVRGRDLYIFGNIGNERIDITNATGSNRVYGGQDSDFIMGSAAGNDFLSGDLGSDTIELNQGAANSLVFGGQGNDAIGLDNNTAVTIYGGQGNDSVGNVDALNMDDNGFSTTSININDDGGALLTSSVVFGNLGIDTLFVDGDSTQVSVYGGQNNDTLIASNQDNNNTSGGRILLSGDLGDDVLAASGSNVTMSGGAGADIFNVAGTEVQTTDDDNDTVGDTSDDTTRVNDTTPLLVTDFQTNVDSITFGGPAGVDFSSSTNTGNYIEITSANANFQTAYDYVAQNQNGGDDEGQYTFFATNSGSYLFYAPGDDGAIQAVQLGNLSANQFQASDIIGNVNNSVAGLNNPDVVEG